MKVVSLRTGIVLAAAVRAASAAPGDVDQTFNPNANFEVFALSIQPDGKIVAGGTFTTMGGMPRPYMARLNSNGSVDGSFNPQPNAHVQSTAVLSSGEIFLTGNFTTVAGTGRIRMARVSANGVPDPVFAAAADADVRTVAFLPNGEMLAGGLFTNVNGTPRSYVARLSSDGELDTGFNPGCDAAVRTAILQPDGKTLLGGHFSTVGGSTRRRLARFNLNGSLDSGFSPIITGTAVYCTALQADGKIIIGGTFTDVNGLARLNLARLNANGTTDPGFNSAASDIVRSVTVQADGKMILTGNFTSIGGAVRNRIARINADGTLDTGFNPNANETVYGSALQIDGRIVIGGLFTGVGGITRNYAARLENNAATQSLTVPSPARIQWLRGGTSPETLDVRFELSVSGGSFWSSLGNGVRIPGGWELTDLSLPASGLIRARAVITCAYGNASSSLVETVTPFAFSAQQMWRHANFGTPDSSGAAADNADPDRDGMENLVEFAFGRNPNAPDAVLLPVWVRSENSYVISFTRPAGVSGVTYTAEYSSGMVPGSWTAVTNTGTAPDFMFIVPATVPRLYMRVRVTAP